MSLRTRFTVAIVGAGPVGLSAAALCDRYGLDCVVLEKHPDTSIHPKARGVSIRTMELLRQWGLESEIRAQGVAPATRGGVTFCRTLSDPVYRYVKIEDEETSRRISLTTGGGCSQERLEAVLKTSLLGRANVDLRFGHTLKSLDGVNAAVGLNVLDAQCREIDIEARYVIAADGARSTVRQVIGAEMVGPSGLSHNMNILFEADLEGLLSSHPSRLYWIDNAPEVAGVLAPVVWPTRWLLNVLYDPATLQAGDFDEAMCRAFICRAIGRDEIPIQFLNAAGWVASAQIASIWRQGHVFLAGDAAHLMPPYGGFGANTGIQDVHNLVWKIAAHRAGWAGPALLQSYVTERTAVAEGTIRTAVERMRALAESKPNLDPAVVAGRKPERYDGVGMGYGYRSEIIIGADDAPIIPDNIQDFVPDGRPGRRAPHVEINAQKSLIDEYEHAFTLVCLGDGDWAQPAAALAASEEGPPCRYVPITGAAAGDFQEAYKIGQSGIVLVRPDGFVAWRADAIGDRHPLQSLREAIFTAAGKR